MSIKCRYFFYCSNEDMTEIQKPMMMMVMVKKIHNWQEWLKRIRQIEKLYAHANESIKIKRILRGGHSTFTFLLKFLLLVKWTEKHIKSLQFISVTKFACLQYLYCCSTTTVRKVIHAFIYISIGCVSIGK